MRLASKYGTATGEQSAYDSILYSNFIFKDH